MTSLDNFEIWARVRKAWTDRDLTALEQFIDPEIVITEPDCVPYRGTFKGISGYMELLKQILSVWEPGIKIEHGDLIGDPRGEKLVIEYFTTACSRRTGKTLTQSKSLALWRFKNGRVVEMTPFNFDTAAVVACLTPRRIESSRSGDGNMSAEDSKQLITNYFDLQRTGRLDELFDLLSEDFVLRGMGMPPFEFMWSKERMRELLRERASFQPDPINIVINGMTAEGERVAVEGVRRDSLRDGTSYNNRYHFLFIVKGGLITRIDEYLCTYSYSEYQKKVTQSS